MDFRAVRILLPLEVAVVIIRIKSVHDHGIGSIPDIFLCHQPSPVPNGLDPLAGRIEDFFNLALKIVDIFRCQIRAACAEVFNNLLLLAVGSVLIFCYNPV